MKTISMLALSLFAWASSMPASALVINITYGAGFQNDTQKQLVATAASWWEAALLSDFNFELTARQVDLAPKGGATLLGAASSNAEMATPDPVTGTRLPTVGTVDIAANRLSEFFFDPTPTLSEEFNMTDRGGTVGTAKAGSDAEGKYDALSVWLHEIGHVLGFIGGTGLWPDNDPYFGYTDFKNNLSGFAPTYTFDWLTGGTEGNIGDTIDLHNVHHTATTPLVSLMNPFFSTGARRLITPIDVDIIADAFHLEFNDQPSLFSVPVPPAWLLLVTGLSCLARSHRKSTAKLAAV